MEVPENSKNFPHDINHHVIGMAGQFDDCLLSGEQCENIYDFKMSSNLSNSFKKKIQFDLRKALYENQFNWGKLNVR